MQPKSNNSNLPKRASIWCSLIDDICRHVINQLIKANQTFDEIQLKKYIELLFFKQYYKIKRKMYNLIGLDCPIHEHIVVSNISKIPDDVLYHIQYKEHSIHTKSRSVRKVVSYIRHSDGTTETITRTNEDAQNVDQSSNETSVQTVYNVTYLHWPSPQLDQNYLDFFAIFIKEFFESDQDCSMKNLYPWPRMRVLRKDDGFYIAYNNKRIRVVTLSSVGQSSFSKYPCHIKCPKTYLKPL